MSRTRSRIVRLIAAGLLVAMLPAGASASEDLVYTTAPGSGAATYLPPVAFADPGRGLVYVNLDGRGHNVTATDPARAQCPAQPGICGDDVPSWCLPPDPSMPWSDANRLPFEPGECPLFWSETVSLGASTPVLGVDSIEPGTQYTFWCIVHPWMEGVLVPLAAR